MVTVVTFSKSCSVEEIKKEWPLVLFFNPDDLLGDVFRGGANTANGQEDVVVKEVASQNLSKGNFKVIK